MADRSGKSPKNHRNKNREEARDMGHPSSRLHEVGDGGGEQVEAFEQAAVGGLRAGEGVAAFAGDGDEALGAAAALGRGAAVAEGDQALRLHAVQRGVERAGRGVAAGLGGNLAEDGDAVRLVAQAQDGEEDDLLEFAEGGVGVHMDYNVVVRLERVKGNLPGTLGGCRNMRSNRSFCINYLRRLDTTESDADAFNAYPAGSSSPGSGGLFPP